MIDISPEKAKLIEAWAIACIKAKLKKEGK
jgi:hypothetical protein